jgi:hypothetical protein
MFLRKIASLKAKRIVLLPILVWTTIPIAQAHATDLFTAIAWCESRGHQFGPHGEVLRSPIDRHWVGKFQINEVSNGADAHARGFNIYTEAGNEGYAHDLYARSGTSPWAGSRHCWARLANR